MTKSIIPEDHTEFSLVLGGPLFRIFRRAHLSGPALELLHRRILFFSLLTWLPLLLLSLISGHALGGSIAVPFLYDIATHVRFLIALPLLVGAELIVHSRIRGAVQKFAERKLIAPEEVSKFRAAGDSAMRLRDSVAPEVALLVLVYTLGLWLRRTGFAAGTATWYATPAGSQLNLTLGGYWLMFVSIPVFQFILLRWYYRSFIWFQFLWRVSRLNLRLTATHPDRAGGIGFLGRSTYAAGPILFAQGTLLSGLIANRFLYEGMSPLAFKLEAVGLVVFFVVVVVSPLCVFTPVLARAKRKGMSEYGRLASGYVQRFDEKWIAGGASREEELLGTSDIQSLADLGNSYAIVREMRLVPFGVRDMVRLAAAAAAPLLPLALTIFSVDELVTRVIKILF